MIDGGGMLLVADGSMAAALRGRFAEGRYVRCGDPYDALLQMSRRRWPAVVLTAPRVGFAGLCRASRRLQRQAKLFAICQPAAEPDVRPLAGEVLDDYFIYPPTSSELQMIASAAWGSEAPARADAGQPQAALSPGDFLEMLAAARTVGGLEAKIASAVTSRCGTPVVWVEAGQAPPQRRWLLLAAGDVPRLLVPADDAAIQVDGSAQNFLSGVQECLPGLIATARRTEALHRLAITDHLTGAYNRRYLYHVTDQILRRSSAKSSRVTLLLFDIDDFKRYNDACGHAAGDEILRQIAQLIKRTTRAQDIVARIGGDEFVVLFWDVAEPRDPDSHPPSTAYVMAERFRRAVAQHQFPSLGPEARGTLTISGGLARFPADGQTCRELLRSADAALRDVKQTGKNAIRLIGVE